jgi:hypothetical protein
MDSAGGCLDHLIIFNERHLRRVLSSYVDCYHRTRTHLSLGKGCPDSRSAQPPTRGKVIAISQLDGLPPSCDCRRMIFALVLAQVRSVRIFSRDTEQWRLL